jgi:hypothetical protein
MNKGIGARQKEILKVINKLLPPGKKGEINFISRELKAHFHQGLRTFKPVYSPKDEKVKYKPEYRENRNILNRARASISGSLAGLIKRGYLYKEIKIVGYKKPTYWEILMRKIIGDELEKKEVYSTYIGLTDEGRGIIKPDNKK